MAKRNAKKALIMDRLGPLAASLGVDLIDVETARVNERRILRLILDKTGGVGIDDCVAMSEAADPIISQELGITDHDFFEVQSAGLNRNLSETADLLRHLGAEVDVKLYKAEDGKKVIEGVLEDAADDTVTIRFADGGTCVFERTAVASVRRGIRF